jgi:hypothetical protein
MTKTDGSLIGGQFVLSFEHSDFGIVSVFGFRYSDFMAIPAPVELPKSRTEFMRQRPRGRRIFDLPPSEDHPPFPA